MNRNKIFVHITLNLLTNLKQEVSYDVSERLRRLYSIRDAVLNCIDADKRDSLDQVSLVRAIDQWIYYSENKNKEGFWEYLRETGLYEEVIEIKSEYAWVFVKCEPNDWESKLDDYNKKNSEFWKAGASISPGNADMTKTYIGKTNTETHHLFHGNYITGNVTWSSPPQTFIRSDEEVSITLSAKTVAAGGDSKERLGENFMILVQYFEPNDNLEQIGSASYFTDEDGNTDLCSGSGNNWAALESEFKATLGTGRKEGERKSIRISVSGVSVNAQYSYVYEWKEIS